MTEPSASLEEVRRILLERFRGMPVKIFLFGSKARGDARRTSDIDIALLPREPLPSGLLGELKEALEESSIPYQVDLLDLCVAEFTLRALGTLREVLALGPRDSIARDAAIQRFEYTFEATWKAAQRFLSVIEGLEAASPRSAIRSSFQVGVLDEEQSRQALAMVHDRNLTTHLKAG